MGWTVGAGIEGVISGNWTAKLEYLYVDLGNVSGSFVTPIVAPSGAFVTASYNSHITDNMLAGRPQLQMGRSGGREVLSFSFLPNN